MKSSSSQRLNEGTVFLRLEPAGASVVYDHSATGERPAIPRKGVQLYGRFRPLSGVVGSLDARDSRLNDSRPLRKEDRGLGFSLDPAPTAIGRDVLELVRRGDLTGASFGFKTLKDDWRRDTAADFSSQKR